MIEATTWDNGKTFTVKDGSTIKLDKELHWLVVNPEDAGEAIDVCVIQVRKPPTPMPTFLYFLKDKLVTDLKRDSDLDAIDEAICAVYPAYKEVVEARLPLPDLHGDPKTLDEWDASPMPGYFGYKPYAELKLV